MPRVAPSERTIARETDRIREVFLSATAKDLKIYRGEVADALKKADAAVFLQEDWAGPAADVVTLSLQRLAESDAYLGMFGFRYGWAPKGVSKSITELECDKALDVWGKKTPPPIFWFMPEPGSDIAREMAKAADQALLKEFPRNAARRDESRQRQREFCDRLRSIGRYITPFSSLQMLRENAITSVDKWNLDILKAAVKSGRRAVPQIPAADLGQIGREDQRRAVGDALQAQLVSGSPGMCLAIHGKEDAGQSAFLAALEEQIKWDIDGEVHVITPSADRFNLVSLTAAALAEMAPGQTFLTPTIDLLAAAIAERCRAAPVVMFLQQVERLSVEIDAFRSAFWIPLLAAAKVLPPTTPARHPFAVVMTLTTPLPKPLPAGMVAAAPAVITGYDDIVVVPKLQPLRQQHVETWLERQKVSLADRKAIAARVTKDGIPRGVYDRLNSDGFWNLLQR